MPRRKPDNCSFCFSVKASTFHGQRNFFRLLWKPFHRANFSQMEVEQLQIMQSDLLALRQLYGLLQNITGFGISSLYLENADKSLDKKALQLLKNLLDDARERHSMRSTHSLQMINVTKQPVNFEKVPQAKFPISNILKRTDEEETEFSNDVVKAIAEIDSRLLDLQLMIMNPVKNNDDIAADFSKTLENKTRYETLSRQASHQPTILVRNDEYLSKNALKNNHALSQITSRINASQTSRGTSYVQGLRVPDMSRDEHDSGSRPSFRIIQNDPTARTASTTTQKTIRRFVPFKPPPDNHDHHKIIMRPTLLMEQDDQRRKSDPSESERNPNSITSPTRSSSSSSSFISPSATESDESENHPLSSSSYSSASPIQNHAKTYFSRRERDSEKRIGGLRQIKNKLGLIFHHHHHHHHHHHDHAPHHNSWKLLQRIFRPKNKAHENKYKQNVTRKTVAKSSNNNTTTKRGRDIEHFHALVEGLMHHAGHRGRGGQLKNPKTGKGGGNNKRLGKGTGWWQRFGGRGGMKMVNRRGRVRVARFANKTPKLKM